MLFFEHRIVQNQLYAVADVVADDNGFPDRCRKLFENIAGLCIEPQQDAAFPFLEFLCGKIQRSCGVRRVDVVPEGAARERSRGLAFPV